MSFDLVLRLQHHFPPFNGISLSLDDLHIWAEKLSIRLIPQEGLHHSSSITKNGIMSILYDPQIPEPQIIFQVSHELGHVALGHLDLSRKTKTTRNQIVSWNRWDHEADIIGLIALIPTWELIRLAKEERLSEEDLYAEKFGYSADYDRGFMRQICRRRMEVFNGLLTRCGGECITDHEACSLCFGGVKDPGRPVSCMRLKEILFHQPKPQPVSINRRMPADGARLIFSRVPVAGISWRADVAARFVQGKEQRVELEREPDNPHDPNAIRVIAHWRGADLQERNRQLGYIPRTTARTIAKVFGECQLTASISAIFPITGDKGAGVRLDLWVIPRQEE